MEIEKMKKQNLLTMLAMVFMAAAIFAGCKKECDCDNDDDNNNGDNWAAAVEGTYTGTANTDGNVNSATTIVTRIDNNTLNFSMSVAGENYCMDSVTMTSASTITIGEYDGCRSYNVTGGGNFSGAALNYTWSSAGGSGYEVDFGGTK
jgi:hypothetical protein